MSTLTEATLLPRKADLTTASNALARAGQTWFIVAATGQLIFAWYMAALYGLSALRGDWETWNKVMPRGWNAGDTVGNIAIFVHLLLALVVTLAGLAQLLPAVRRAAPSVHRWIGRVYIASAFGIAFGSMYLMWVRGAVGDFSQHLGSTFNAILLVLFAVIALRHARARNLALHRQWALRLFMVMNGVWFFRLGLLLWLMIHQQPVGFDPKTFTGPFLTFLVYAQTLLPLAALELYFRAQRSDVAARKWSAAAVIAVLALATAGGVVGATMGLWLPRL
ncbi:DUF2306 domain-containing protein [Casimicrobium huifangae]|uniref:DUF2306 domain-containing protein n=1 Tax=Casimicrobium huifangae TaxID=2591109 RepID=UPI0012EBE66A|nr:DUF2306 domain-containing protein [Casimicrobium huifangae]HOB01825.1 DUF2306 domain-containing protein [Casimicrobium huifangae]